MTTEHNDIIENLNKHGLDLAPEQAAKLARKLHEMRSYVPKVGVFGKTGVGKSSLCNAIFGEDVCAISDVEACTREPQEMLLSIGGSGGLKLLDVPGVGENHERDKEYDDLYQSLLPELDLIFWVFKSDDRAAASDEEFYNRIIRRYVDAGKPFLAVVNQVDKIEPFREWDVDERKPSSKQLSNIEKKRSNIASLLDIPMGKVIAVSAGERYGLTELVDSIVHALPNEQKQVVLEKIKAADDAEILAAQARAAEAEAAAEALKAKNEAERIALEKAQAEQEERRLQREHERQMSELQATQERERHERKMAQAKSEQEREEQALRMAELKARQEAEERERQIAEQRANEERAQQQKQAEELKAREKAQLDAEEKARRDRAAAEERERNRNVSAQAEKEAENGSFSTIVTVVTDVATAVLRLVIKRIWGR